MTALLIGYARCSTDQQDLTAQRNGLATLGVALNRVYVKGRLRGSNPSSISGKKRTWWLFKGREYSTAPTCSAWPAPPSSRLWASAGSRGSDRRSGWLTGCDVPQAAPLRDSNILLASKTFGHRSWFRNRDAGSTSRMAGPGCPGHLGLLCAC